MMHGRGKSDSAIVAVKPTNKAERSAAEPVEPRAETKGNADQQSTYRAQNRISVSQALDCMRQALAVWTRGRSRMRESCTYGSVRGALSNERPYRDHEGRGADGYSITSLARARSMSGTPIPNALAVFRLRTSSNFVGCSAGMFAGVAPCRIFTTKCAPRLNASVASGP